MVQSQPRMDQAQRHKNAADRNQAFAREILECYPDWSTTACFYSALHYVQQYASACGERVSGHVHRGKWIAGRKELREMRWFYDQLEAFSNTTRYQCPPPGHFLLDSKTVGTKVFSYLRQVQRAVAQAMQRLQAG